MLDIRETNKSYNCPIWFPKENFYAAELEGGTQAKPHSLHDLRGWKWKSRDTEEGRIDRAEEGKRKMLGEKSLEISKVFL